VKITAAQALLKVLEANGTEILFGYPGAAVAPVYQALKKEPIRHVLTRTEQGAAHMAAAQARVCGKVGVCLATSGPGSTNLLTAIAGAYVDSMPLVAITAQVSTPKIGTDAFQEVDTTGVTAPVTKHNYLVKQAEDLPRVVQEAFYLAQSGRPGPVVIDIPYDILKTKIEWQPPKAELVRGYQLAKEPEADDIDRLAAAIRRAKRPVLVVGGGVILAGAQKPLSDFLNCCGMTAVCTMMGLTALPADFPHFLGMVGTHGTNSANKAFSEADLVIFVGSRITEHTLPDPEALASRAMTAHIDIDPAELDKNCPCHISLCADAGAVLRALTKQLGKDVRLKTPPTTMEERETGSREKYVDPKAVFAALREQIKTPAVFATEVGEHQIWAARYFAYRAGDVLLTSGGFGAMGYGLPAAIGGAISAPDKTVIAIEGDGSFQMAMPDLATLVETGAKVKILLFNNQCLGLVREADKVSPKAAHVHLSAVPDFCALAAAYGIPSRRLSGGEDINEAIKTMLAAEGAYLLEVSTDPQAHT